VKHSSNNQKETKEIEPLSHSLNIFKSVKELNEFIESTDMVASTIFNSQNTFFNCTKFDICLLNEASLMVEPVSLIPILYSKRFVMIGDYYQLNPVIKSYEADKRGMSISLFRKLCERYPYKVCILR
jgi:DNA replication ATP-dependent helicase Dna2